jgi:hypothetical protein
VLGEEICVGISVLPEESRRALDVREEEGDRARREPARVHAVIIASA